MYFQAEPWENAAEPPGQAETRENAGEVLKENAHEARTETAQAERDSGSSIHLASLEAE
jgi:hypothetical protein